MTEIPGDLEDAVAAFRRALTPAAEDARGTQTEWGRASKPLTPDSFVIEMASEDKAYEYVDPETEVVVRREVGPWVESRRR